MNLEVKYGYIRLINTQADLCKEIKNVDLECPIEKGEISILKSVELPKEIPPVRRPLVLGDAEAARLTVRAGKIHGPGRRLQQGRRAYHLPDCHRGLWQEVAGRSLRPLRH